MTAATLKRGARVPKSARARPVRPATMAPVFGKRQVLIALAVVFAIAIAVMIAVRVPQKLWAGFVTWTAANGWEVRHVELTGAREQDRLAIYAAALNGPTNAMLATDLDAVRARLRALPWVADASVQRRLPDTLVIEVTERRPVALWQKNRHLAAIDLSGRVLTAERLERWNDLPILIGPNANARVHEALELLAATPLGRDVMAATLVGGRRWDLHFKSGEVLALPDRPAVARGALTAFAKLDGQGPQRLIGGGFTRFDLRLPGRMTVAGPAVAKTLADAEKARRAAAQASKI
ncbi:cell division protein FtsQ/DivIB [Sandarakinorhabdus sp.]|uniref:cell division protein FtsQ/DivIB n=1 Tax=Sandarakinorhabdus sp. TaxID=1916663 RepID=UPI003F6E4A2D